MRVDACTEEVKACHKEQQIIIKTAAVADYRPAHVADEKIKKKEGDNYLELERTEDILAYQFDFVCNGNEMASGAVRNHDIEIMEKAFENYIKLLSI